MDQPDMLERLESSPRKKNSRGRCRWLKRLLILGILAVLGLLAGFFVFMPDIARLRTENPGPTALMEFRQAEAKAKGKTFRVRQQWVPLVRISPKLVQAVIIGEDDKFWQHEGFDFTEIQNAIEKDIKTGKFKRGASTISQQLVKNLWLSPSKNPLRKLTEALITWRMEQILNKKRILEIYLNVIEWGDGIFGIETAARHYYDKPASDLTAAESARLAAVLPNPRKFDPRSDRKYVINRSRIIATIMAGRGLNDDVPADQE